MPPATAYALPAGTEIGGYRLVRVLGAGGFGITYEAISPYARRRWAIKEFFPQDFASREDATRVVYSDSDLIARALRQFEESTGKLGELDHPNIVKVVHYIKENATGYMVMDYVEGPTFEAWLRSRPQPPTLVELRPILEKIFDALEYAHACDAVHRDIAPDNVILRRDDEPILIDFGALKVIDARAAPRLSSLIVRKQYYSPPEQSEAGVEVRPAMDVYALAALLYRAFTGTPPVDADARKHERSYGRDDPYVPLAGRDDLDLPDAMRVAIDRALSYRADERPQTIRDFRDALAWDAPTGDASADDAPTPEAPPGAATDAPPTQPAFAEASPGVGPAVDGSSPQPLDSSPPEPPARDRSRVAAIAVIATVLVLAVVGLFALAQPRPAQQAGAPGTQPPPSSQEPPKFVPQQRAAPKPTPLAAAAERALRPGESFGECNVCPAMTVVPAGSFTMGSPAKEPRRSAVEGPQRKVALARPFAAGRFHVAVDQFAAFVNATGHKTAAECWTFDTGKWEARIGLSWRNPGFAQAVNDPVVCVSWNDAKAYVAWLSSLTGKGYRLLTEAEREYVTRAGTTTPFWWGNTISTDQANYGAGSGADEPYQKGPAEFRRGSVSVDRFQPNAWGFFQVHGNAWNWTEDCWNDSYKGAPADGAARVTGDCSRRVVRGGGWNNLPHDLRAAFRHGNSADIPSNNTGIRVGRTLDLSAPNPKR